MKMLPAVTNKKAWVAMVVLLLGTGVVACSGNNPSGNVLIDDLSEPLNGANSAKIDINSGMGHLTIQRLVDAEQLLSKATLQYLGGQGLPDHTVNMNNGRATFTLRAGGIKQSGFRFPWAACGGAYKWQINLNPTVSSDITAHSDGGNIKLGLAGMIITHLSADSEGGNMDVILPDNAADLTATATTGGGNVNIDLGNSISGRNAITANSGAGSVLVRLPKGIVARIHAITGAGKVTVDPQFAKIDKDTYQSADYDSAVNKVEIMVKSGAGNVSVNTR